MPGGPRRHQPGLPGPGVRHLRQLGDQGDRLGVPGRRDARERRRGPGGGRWTRTDRPLPRRRRRATSWPPRWSTTRCRCCAIAWAIAAVCCPSRCECGLAFPLLGVVTGPRGRHAGARRAAAGSRPTRSPARWSGSASVLRYQVTQLDPARVRVRAIAHPRPTAPPWPERIRAVLRTEVAPFLEAEVEFVDRLAAGPRAKFRVVEPLGSGARGVTAGRPEIAPALSAVWRHGRAPGAELRLWQDARLRRLVQPRLRVGAVLPPPVRPPPAPSPARPRGPRPRDHPVHRQDRAAPSASRRPAGERATTPRRCSTVRTSGSSGEPFTIRRTWLEDKLQYLLRLRALQGLGVRPRDLVVAVGVGRPESGDRKLVGRTLRALGLHTRVLLDGLADPVHIACELRRAPARRARRAAGHAQPADGCPSWPGALETVRPRLVVVGGEVTTPAMRARLGRTFAAPVYETYGSHECPLIAAECPWSGTLHACEDAVLVEVLRDGRPVEPGEQGEVVVTNLHAYAMPFIRYRIGDLATRAPSCACGLAVHRARRGAGPHDRLLPAARRPAAASLRDRDPPGLGQPGMDPAVPAGAGAAGQRGALRGGRGRAVRASRWPR